MPEHSVLTGASLHEPKGASTASAGQVYIADGVGSGAWTSPSGSTYGQLYIANNTTTISLTAATTGLNVDSEYVKVDTGIWDVGAYNNTTPSASGYIEIETDGIYEISMWTSFSCDTINTLMAFKFSTGDSTATLSPQKLSRYLAATNTIGNIAASGYYALSAGDKLALYVAADNSCNIKMADAGMTCVLLQET